MMGKNNSCSTEGHKMEMDCCKKHEMSKEHLEMKKKMLEEKLKWVNENLKGK
jgi:hypothetical protein